MLFNQLMTQCPSGLRVTFSWVRVIMPKYQLRRLVKEYRFSLNSISAVLRQLLDLLEQVWFLYEILTKLLKLMDSLSCPLCPARFCSWYIFDNYHCHVQSMQMPAMVKIFLALIVFTILTGPEMSRVFDWISYVIMQTRFWPFDVCTWSGRAFIIY